MSKGACCTSGNAFRPPATRARTGASTVISPHGWMDPRNWLTDPKNPYRTHGKPGLTPTPINNPGEAALKGAMSPPQGPWLYFVAIDKQGHSAFATRCRR